ncbi:ATP-NAD kinase [Mesorhizobium sp. B2-4-19]|uniref:ATP-NAD kinase family protein n=1 Tax=Mesorhizobium sp. B2-4-19 TaxID=2589930 RepID=UPI00112CACCB|nr:NAD(+)/NADH kinase [Mesorhizobium sp. B2-4-19]TPK65609.1 ATP-NAD kinase [Mesorhizobium sp. B2-4-19]
MKRLGLIINPMAGVGGSVALKGSDGVYDEAQRRGAVPRAPERTLRALHALRSALSGVCVVTCTGRMGEAGALTAGLTIETLIPVAEPTTAADTRRAARAMAELGVDLLLFAGGDGTATDVHGAVDDRLPVVGVPAGVKMHSGVFAPTPEAAGALAAQYLGGQVSDTIRREVMDIDEALLRAGVLAPRLLGSLLVPQVKSLLQRPKTRGTTEDALRRALGRAVMDELAPDALVAVGPGTTAGAVMEIYGLPHTLLGFDLIRGGRLVAADVTANDLLDCADDLHVVLAPIGGQGFLLGRGNQQLTSAVLRRINPSRVLIVATTDRLAALQGQPLLIDVDDPEIAATLTGKRRIITGPGRVAMYPVLRP